MAKPWITLDKADIPGGVLELRKRGERDFLILINNRVLMNSGANRSETVLGEAACRMIVNRDRPRVLVGGLGMGLTLRAALDVLPPRAQVSVAELNPVILTWCEGPLAGLTGHAVHDPRVSVRIADIAMVIGVLAASAEERLDAVIIDLYEGPHAKTDTVNDPFYGSRALEKAAAALVSGGIFAVWGDNPDAGFEKRLKAAGFNFERLRPGRGGLRHVVYLARKTT